MNRAKRRDYARHLAQHEENLRGLAAARVGDVALNFDDVVAMSDLEREALMRAFRVENAWLADAAEYMDFHRSQVEADRQSHSREAR